MSTQSAPYFWLVCDGCGERSTEGGDFSAWSDHGAAADEALDRGWQINDEGDFCEDCRRPMCAGCGEHNATTEYAEDTWCDECIVEEVAEA